MLLKQPLGKGRIYDILHRMFITSCMAVTALAVVGAAISFDHRILSLPAGSSNPDAVNLEDKAVPLESKTNV